MAYKNISEEAIYLKDTYLNSEKELLANLTENEKWQHLVNVASECNIETLFATAQSLINKVEYNMIPYEEMGKIETELTILLSAIQNKVNVSDFTRDYDIELAMIKSR